MGCFGRGSAKARASVATRARQRRPMMERKGDSVEGFLAFSSLRWQKGSIAFFVLFGRLGLVRVKWCAVR